MGETGRRWGLHFPSLSMWTLYGPSLIWKPWRSHSVTMSDDRAVHTASPYLLSGRLGFLLLGRIRVEHRKIIVIQLMRSH
jgi:hypothetical protein